MNSRKKNSVLIVDDERINISSLKTILSGDYTIYASTNGKDAIETANKFLPDIILLDVLMPNMDGFEVIAAFKASEKTRDIPVVFITGLDSHNAEIKGLALGAADYISKPFNPPAIKLRIQNHIQLAERLHQESLITKIAHNYIANPHTDEMNTETLRITGEFLGNASILLYRLKKNKMLICQNEWLNPQLNLETRIDDRIELNDDLILSINKLLSGSEKDLCIHSSNPFLKKSIVFQRNYLENFIITPVFIKGNMDAILVFSWDDNREWSESEIDLAVLIASIFSGVFERDAIQHAEYLSRAKSAFLSRMNHEMRTPLNVIIGLLQIIKMTGAPENINKHCNIMNKEAQNLLCMIEDVLDFSDMEGDTFRLSYSIFDIHTEIRDVLETAVANAGKKEQTLNYKIDPVIPNSISGDKNRLKQVIRILLSNAIKFTPEKGEISFNAHQVKEDNETITLKIEVADNGIGMSKQDQENLFSVFEQADTGYTREYGGIGAGLALSKRIVKMMDGIIDFESEPGKGSKFYFTCLLKKEK